MRVPICPDEERLAAYLEGSLGESDRAELEQHLKHCPDCKATVRQAKETPASAQAGEPPSHVLSRLKKEVK